MAYLRHRYPPSQPMTSYSGVRPHRRLYASGFWSAWGVWSRCSKTCNSGAQQRSRVCKSRYREIGIGLPRCNGYAHDYRACNTQKCASLKVLTSMKYDERKQQCSVHDTIPYIGRLYRWLPFMREGLDECKLHCLASGFPMFATFGNVQNGISCGDRNGMKCSNGKCLKTMHAYEPAMRQHTSTSRHVSSASRMTSQMSRQRHIFIKKAFRVDAGAREGYLLAFNIPKGARNIRVHEMKPTKSYLAVKVAGRFFLNEVAERHSNTSVSVAGAVLSYMRTEEEAQGSSETIVIRKKIHRDIQVMLYHAPGSVVDIAYNYSIPAHLTSVHFYPARHPRDRPAVGKELTQPGTGRQPTTPRQSAIQARNVLDVASPQTSQHRRAHVSIAYRQGDPPAVYGRQNTGRTGSYVAPPGALNTGGYRPPSYAGGSFGGRSLPQQGGLRFQVGALNRASGRLSSGGGQSRNVRPMSTQRRTGPAEYRWQVSGFTACSARCGGGEQNVVFGCLATYNRRDGRFVPNSHCRKLSPAPVKKRVCNQQPCPSSWIVGNWSECSKTCGLNSVRIRPVECKEVRSSSKGKVAVAVDERKCRHHKKPHTRKKCSYTPCYFKWKTGEWGRCTRSCGQGRLFREVFCERSNGFRIPDANCDSSKKPLTSQACFLKLCKTTWFASEWSPCSSVCGPGTRYRHVLCSTQNGGLVTEARCSGEPRPVSQTTCDGEPCQKGLWVTSAWSKCSRFCGSGAQSRMVFCAVKRDQTHAQVDEIYCTGARKPIAQRACHNLRCPALWYAGSWEECTASCGGGVQMRSKTCLMESGDLGRGCQYKSIPATMKSCHTHACTTPIMTSPTTTTTTSASTTTTTTTTAPYVMLTTLNPSKTFTAVSHSKIEGGQLKRDLSIFEETTTTPVITTTSPTTSAIDATSEKSGQIDEATNKSEEPSDNNVESKSKYASIYPRPKSDFGGKYQVGDWYNKNNRARIQLQALLQQRLDAYRERMKSSATSTMSDVTFAVKTSTMHKQKSVTTTAHTSIYERKSTPLLETRQRSEHSDIKTTSPTLETTVSQENYSEGKKLTTKLQTNNSDNKRSRFEQLLPFKEPQWLLRARLMARQQGMLQQKNSMRQISEEKQFVQENVKNQKPAVKQLIDTRNNFSRDMFVAQPTKWEDPANAVFDKELNQRDNAKVLTNTRNNILKRIEDGETKYKTKQKETNDENGSNRELLLKQNTTLAKVEIGKQVEPTSKQIATNVVRTDTLKDNRDSETHTLIVNRTPTPSMEMLSTTKTKITVTANEPTSNRSTKSTRDVTKTSRDHSGRSMLELNLIRLRLAQRRLSGGCVDFRPRQYCQLIARRLQYCEYPRFKRDCCRSCRTVGSSISNG